MKSCKLNLGFSLAVLSGLIISSNSAFGFAAGQYGYTGRDNSCLYCHGSLQYEGLAVEVVSGTEEYDCWVDDGNDSLKMIKAHSMDADGVIELKLTVEAPTEESNTPVCPAHDCCTSTITIDGEGEQVSEELGDPPEDATCVTERSGDCTTFFAACPNPVAGFNMEVVGGGTFSILEDDDSNTIKVLENGTDADGSEVTHVQPETLLSEDVSWRVNFTGPGTAEAGDAVTFYVGANVANGNGYADGLDLNSNYILPVTIGSGLPSYCAICSDGSEPSSEGTCGDGEEPAACGCDASSESDAPFSAALALFVFGGLVLRRKR
jgi:uncharacterized protein (TIGR03382 family)